MTTSIANFSMSLQGTPLVNNRLKHGSSCHRSVNLSAIAPRASASAVSPQATAKGAANRVRLGDSDLMVSECCLGTMTWGNQNTEAEAHAQLSHAILDAGLNFIDTAGTFFFFFFFSHPCSCKDTFNISDQ